MKNNPSYEELLTELNNLKEFEQQLINSEKKYRAVTQTATDAIITINSDGIIFSWNNAAEKIFGYSSSEIINKNLSKIIPAQYKVSHRAAMKRLKNKGKEKLFGKTIEITALRKDGTEFPIELSLSSWETDNQKYYSGIIRDITERLSAEQAGKRAEELKGSIYMISEAAHSAENLEELFKLIHQAIGQLVAAKNFYIALYDADSEMLSFPYFVDEYDETPAPKKLGRGLTEYVLRTGKLLLASPKVFEKLVKKGEVESIGAPSIDWLGVPLKTKDTTIGVLVIQSYTEGVRFKEEAKEILMFVSSQVAMAIEHKQSEEALFESEERYRKFFMEDLTGDYLSTREGKIIDCNPQFLKIYGFKSLKEAQNFNANKFYESKSDREKFIKKVEKNKVLLDEQSEQYKVNGEKIVLQKNVSGEFDDDGKLINIRGYLFDITKRVKAEQELIKLSTAVEQNPVSIMITDTDGVIEYVNPSFENITGYSSDEVIGLKPNVLKSGITPESVYHQLWKTITAGKIWEGELLNKKKNGELYWESSIVSPVKDNNDNITHYLALNENITEKKNISSKLQDSEEKYRTLTENIPLGVYRNTPGARGKFIEINRALVEMFGYKDKKSLMATEVSKLYALPSSRKQFSNNLTKKGRIKNAELQLIKKDGTTFVGSSTAIAVKDNKGKIIYYDGIIEDITERVVLRNKLIENEEKYSSIVNNSPDIIMRVDQKGKIIYINYTYAGQKPEEVIGKTIYDLMPSEFHDKAKDALIKVFDTGKSFSYENIGLSHEDEVVWYKNHIGPIRSNSNVIGATIIASDITERKQIDIMKNEFISSVSHELRTPLTIIQESISQVLEGIYGDLNDIQKEVLSPCMEDINRLNRIINDLLDISKIEGQKILINREMVDIVNLAKNVLSSFNHKAVAKNIELKFKTSSEAIEVYIDNDRIIQVFMNLIDNAVKFTKKGEIEVSIMKSENSVECIVSDSGRGIEHKELATVFDRFHQVGKIVSAEEKGTGLGLSISKGIVKLHNGKIWVDSKINKGSQFNFTLPIYTTDEILLENIEKGIVKATKKHIKLSLLIIRLDNFAEIEKNCGFDKAKETTRKVLEAFQDVIAPGEFSFIKGRNEVILFSDITQKNISSIVEKLENILANFISNFSKELDIVLSYGYSIYPNDANSAKDLLQSAYKTLLIKNNHK